MYFYCFFSFEYFNPYDQYVVFCVTLTHDILVLCSDSAAAKAYCENTVCPSLSASSSQVKPDSCCVWHVNIHSCPISTNVSYCGPWISPSGTLYTHSAVLWGDVNRGNWTSNVRTLQTFFFFFFFFDCMFYQLLHVPHSSSSTQSWGSVLPSIVETRDQNSRGCPLLFSNRNLGSFCA